MQARAKAVIAVDMDMLLAEGIEPCRDERCPVVDLHAAHLVVGRKGRTCKSCPNCFKPVRRMSRTLVICPNCDWSRSKD